MKKFIAGAIALTLFSLGLSATPKYVKISKEDLLDKIKGGWAGQTIGCTYGGPTEFRYRERMIPDSIKIKWDAGYVASTMTNNKYLYDDIYMDLTFVDVFDKKGLDAPIEEFANAFTNAGYTLWHANQQARFNIHHGIMPPESGHWLNNPHADDIDFQIEADYAGLMAPGMTDAACHYADGIGHMMNYGDGWYGGVYVAAMYSMAFVYNNVYSIADEALKVIPQESRYYKCMSDVIRWHKMYPFDWKQTWNLIEKKYGTDIGCPAGVEQTYNIDAVINSAYILVGLLYGDGNFEKSIDIACRCGQDSDCNPASVGGILGAMLGYSKIPAKFLDPLKEAEDINFAYTDISLNKTYDMSYNQALKVIELNGGKVSKKDVKIQVDYPTPVRFEQCFEGLTPTRYPLHAENNEATFEFDGKGVVVCGDLKRVDGKTNYPEYTAMIDVYLDGQLVKTQDFPAAYRWRQEHIWHNYQLTDGHHTVTVRCTNPFDKLIFNPTAYIVYR